MSFLQNIQKEAAVKKSELVERLNRYASRHEGRHDESADYARYLARYLNTITISQDSRMPEQHIDRLLPQLTVRALHALRTGDEGWIASFRKALHIRTAKGKTERVDVETICDVIASATESEAISEQVQAYLEAERRVVDVTFYRFMESVYLQGGLYDKIQQGQDHAMTGKFGKTTLRTYRRGHDKLLITFVRPTDTGELVVSYVCKESDPAGLTGRREMCAASWLQATKMIDEVIKLWPSESANFASESVSFA